jgi:hypothetical protein
MSFFVNTAERSAIFFGKDKWRIDIYLKPGGEEDGKGSIGWNRN